MNYNGEESGGVNWLKEQIVNGVLGIAFMGILLGACWVADALSDWIIG